MPRAATLRTLSPQPGAARRLRPAALLMIFAALTTACRTGIVYVGDAVPMYGGTALQPRLPQRGDTVRVATFNIQYGRHIDRALAVLQSDPALREADVLLLQEMDAAGTRTIAEALQMHWVYYPAVQHTRTGRDFGNAVLSHWPIIEHERLLLPHTGLFTRTRRAATAATLDLGERRLRVYSVHLATMINLGPRGRADQLCAVAEDALRFEHSIIGGDLNSSIVAEALDPDDWQWPTMRGAPTSIAGRLDHILLSGLAAVPGRGAVIRDARGASDHRPLWLDAVLAR